MSARRKGPQCAVDACYSHGAYEAFLAVRVPEDDRLATTSFPTVTHADPLVVCLDHARQLGSPTKVAGQQWVDIDPERAPGWRLVVEVRPKGHHAIVLYPPVTITNDPPGNPPP